MAVQACRLLQTIATDHIGLLFFSYGISNQGTCQQSASTKINFIINIKWLKFAFLAYSTPGASGVHRWWTGVSLWRAGDVPCCPAA
jgi:hypothetical protein